MNTRSLLATVLVTISIISLQANGQEEGADCEVPKEFPKGRLRPVSREYRDRSIVPTGIDLQFKCDEGHELNGADRVVCSNGTWEPRLPTCVPLQANGQEEVADCEVPKEFPKGRLRPISRIYRDRSIVPTGIGLQIKCDKGYELNGADRVVCSNGTWKPGLPTCVRSKVECRICCELPSNFTNGKVVSLKEELYGRSLVVDNGILHFICNSGYALHGETHSFCVGGDWLPQIPSCIRNSCHKPPPVEHGRAVADIGKEVFPLGANISYECDDDYELVKTVTVVCTENFSWEGEIPECKEKVKCNDPGTGSRAFREGKCCEEGDVLNYSCIEEYEIAGPSAITCTADGTWNSTRPRCQPVLFCDVPDKIPHGKICAVRNGNISVPGEEEFFFTDDEIMIICDKGYSVGNQSDYLLCLSSGQWDEDIPTCAPFHCIIPDPPENGNILELEKNENLSVVPYDFEINFACRPGYRGIGNSWIRCGEYGWTASNARCEEIRCPDPGQIEHGWTQGTDYRIGNATYYGCFSGYSLLGSHKRDCLENGQWGGELPRCNKEDNYCPNPGTPTSGTKIGSRYDLGSEVHFQCNPGSILIGSANRTCQRNREWSGEPAKCFGQNDFDDRRAVGSTIKDFLHEADVVQEVSRSRSIDLNFAGRLIFVFIFDVSGSVGEQDFKRSVAFAKAIVKTVKMDTSGARVGAITFSSKASIEINPLELDNEEKVLEQLDRIEYKKGGTATSSALVLLKDRMMPLTFENFGNDCKFITFLLTDGKANMAGNPQKDADDLKDRQVEIFCIGITGNRRMAALYEIASSRDKHVFILDSYESLNWLVDDIINSEVDYSRCGVRRSTAAEFEEEDERGRVIKGKEVIKNWPWMAVVFTVDPLKPDTTKPLSVCGAALISNKWLLTAAHCMHSKEKRWKTKEDFIVHLGITDLRNSTTLKKLSVAGYIVHPSYSMQTYDNDIAVVELLPHATYNEFIRPICLPTSADDVNTDPTFYRPGQKAAVVGWGYDKPLKDGEKPLHGHVQVARRIVIPLQKRETCADSLKKVKNHVFTDQMICAGGKGMDTCRGDSGGPLMRKLTNNIREEYWTAIGIVSWGIGCGQPGTYGFYTKVSLFTEWIDEVTRKDYCIEENPDNEDVCHY